ncbi:L,D-transpeptidase [Pseudonocardia nigra]|uniref:L,D-transpeptidase n=1 Tax=Pseudonocardia nigra TaxID=1921578 RepID=UPI001C5F2805|nr:L,D-transpeptidase [Pseudonocardia nigra]
MGTHARSGARRTSAVRAAGVAALLAVTASVLIGVGSAQGAADAPAGHADTPPAAGLLAPALEPLTAGPVEAPRAAVAADQAAPAPSAPRPAQPAESEPAESERAESEPAEQPARSQPAGPLAGLPGLAAQDPAQDPTEDPAPEPTAAPAAPAPAAAPATADGAAPTESPLRTLPVRGGAAPADAPSTPGLVTGTPCTATARACVNLAARQAWLIDAGKVVRGPVPIQTGDQDTPTPRGTFQVQWKAEQYTSREYLTQMPYSVFFAEGGIAFHEGWQDTPSAGCVKLVHADALAWFDFLQVGDEVQIH